MNRAGETDWDVVQKCPCPCYYNTDLHEEVKEWQAALDRLKAERDELVGVADGVIWLDNNLHNYGSVAWRDFFKAVLRDARRARAQAKGGP